MNDRAILIVINFHFSLQYSAQFYNTFAKIIHSFNFELPLNLEESNKVAATMLQKHNIDARQSLETGIPRQSLGTREYFFIFWVLEGFSIEMNLHPLVGIVPLF